MVVLDVCAIGEARHAQAIHERAIVEAFPSSYLGMMLTDPMTIAASRKNRSDVFFATLVGDGTLRRLLEHFLPGRKVEEVELITNHDDRAAFVCSVTALSVAAGDFTAVGDEDGWIILPPISFIASWAEQLLRENEEDEETGRFAISCARIPVI